MRARRGDPDVRPLLDEALALTQPSGELQRDRAGVAARAEAARGWDARHERVAMETEAALELALRRQAPWAIGGSVWRRRWCAGISRGRFGDRGAYAAELSGDRDRAAAFWNGPRVHL